MTSSSDSINKKPPKEKWAFVYDPRQMAGSRSLLEQTSQQPLLNTTMTTTSFSHTSTAHSASSTAKLVYRPAKMPDPPRHYLRISIIVTICCFISCGVQAIRHSMHCRNAIAAGDRVKAQEASRMALRCNLLAVAFGVTLISVNVIIFVVLKVTETV